MVICLEQGADDLHIVLLMALSPHHGASLPQSSRKRGS